MIQIKIQFFDNANSASNMLILLLMDATNSLFPVNIASDNNSLYCFNNANSSSLLLGASAVIVQTKSNFSNLANVLVRLFLYILVEADQYRR